MDPQTQALNDNLAEGIRQHAESRQFLRTEGESIAQAKADMVESAEAKEQELNNKFLIEQQTLLSIANNQFNSGIIIPEAPIKLAPARRLGAYDVDEATLISDVNVTLPGIQWDNSAGAEVAEGNPQDIYAGATTDMTSSVAIPSSGGEAAPVFWDIPSINKILPNVRRAGKENGYAIGGRVPALIIKVDVGSSYRPHAIRRTFVDVVASQAGQAAPAYHAGSYSNPKVSARNVAIDGFWYAGNYISTIVIPINPAHFYDYLRVVNNGHIDLEIYSYAFAWINKKEVS